MVNEEKRKKYSKNFIEKMKEIHPNIKIIGDYIDAHTNIKCECLVCGYKWESRPNNLLNKHGCPKCANREHLDQKTFIDKMNEVNPNIIVLGKYINKSQKIKVKCNLCNFEWDTRPYLLLSGHGCPKCKAIKASKLKLKSHKDFLSDLYEVNKDIKILEQYKGKEVPTLFQCNTCNTIWKARPGNILRGSGCPHCKSSRGEKRINKYLIEHNIPFIPQYSNPACRNLSSLKFDFAITSDSKKYILALIEYDGEQHYEGIDFSGRGEVEKSLWKVQRNDKIKNDFCKKHNILLLRIPYWDYDNIENILDDFIEQVKEKFSKK